LGDVINLKEWKEKKLAEEKAKPKPTELVGYDGEPLDDAFEMAQIMYDSRKDRLAEEQENLDDALDSLNESVKILEEASTKVLEDAKKRT